MSVEGIQIKHLYLGFVLKAPQNYGTMISVKLKNCTLFELSSSPGSHVGRNLLVRSLVFVRTALVFGWWVGGPRIFATFIIDSLPSLRRRHLIQKSRYFLEFESFSSRVRNLFEVKYGLYFASLISEYPTIGLSQPSSPKS